MFKEENKEHKSRKLTAARQKLKEYQQRNSLGITNIAAGQAKANTNANEIILNSGQISSSASERSLSECHLNGSSNSIEVVSTYLHGNNENEFKNQCNEFTSQNNSHVMFAVNNDYTVITTATAPLDSSEKCMTPVVNHSETTKEVDTIQVLINEKHIVTAELTKYRSMCRAKELEIGELLSQQANLTKRYEELQRYYKEQQKQIEQQQSQDAEVQHKVAQLRAQNEDFLIHTEELQKELRCKDVEIVELKKTLTEKLNKFELSQLRVQQLSNMEEENKEKGSAKDHLIETLNQKQYMYEQQIRDLQAMVQQLNCDKEQANAQYQTYVQQLNIQRQQLHERNNELTDDVQRLQEREKQLVDHVQQLEKDIQKNIIRQEQYKEELQQKVNNSHKNVNNKEVQKLQTRLQEYEFARDEFQLKIKSQEDYLTEIKCHLEEKRYDIEQLKGHLDRIKSEQPDKNKLLAEMESNKVAAARALTQNVEMKRQLDELEKRFVQLTNDKSELMHRLDAEQYKSREVQHNYEVVVERLRNYDEKFKFKDEEMIRLSNENEQLKTKNSSLLHQQKERQQQQQIIRLEQSIALQDHDHNLDQNVYQYIKTATPEITISEKHNQRQQQQHSHEHHHYINNDNVTCEHFDTCSSVHEAKEKDTLLKSNTKTIATSPSELSYISTDDAVEKLQQRLTHLMSQVAELTDEKQRLEHLVLQLQSETETIGEYIALYQTQRRILKQREYDRLTQAQLLQTERQQMHERLTLLNNLINSLGVKFPGQPQQQSLQQQQHQQYTLQTEQMENMMQLDNQIASFNQFKQNGHETVTAQNLESINASTQPINQQQLLQNSPQHIDEESTILNVELNTRDSQQILHKIHDIISEIKENTKQFTLSAMTSHNEDQLTCCMGKFKVV